ncbi:MAG: hypothetical protein WC307_05250 [Candidatus Nanoarchaeia archaeon]|jgi:hypothetical protein
MDYIDVKSALITSGTGASEGIASGSFGSAIGSIYKIEVENDATSTPTNDWDLTIYSGTVGGPDYEAFFTEETIANTKTSKIVYYPRKKVDLQDGTASTITEEPCMIFNRELKYVCANMGDTKIAKVKVFIVR